MSQKNLLAISASVLLASCAQTPVHSFQGYQGDSKPDSAVAIVRLWTPTQSSTFTSPALIVQEIDGQPVGDFGSVTHAYLMPGEHTFQVKFVQIKFYNLLCGRVCDAIFNQPRIFKSTVAAGEIYVPRFVNDEAATVIMEDKGAGYDHRCLTFRDFKADNCK